MLRLLSAAAREREAAVAGAQGCATAARAPKAQDALPWTTLLIIPVTVGKECFVSLAVFKLPSVLWQESLVTATLGKRVVIFW